MRTSVEQLEADVIALCARLERLRKRQLKYFYHGIIWGACIVWAITRYVT